MAPIFTYIYVYVYAILHVVRYLIVLTEKVFTSEGYESMCLKRIKLSS